MRDTTFEDALAFGSEGEDAVARWLMRCGVTVLPLYQFKGHEMAPKMYQAEGTMTCPDLTCFARGAFFVEVKRKRRWTRWRDRTETGCDLRLWRDYCQVADATRLPVFLFFLHDSGPNPGLYYGTTTRLATEVREWDGRHHKTGCRISPPLALFPSTALRRVPLDQMEAA